MVLTLSGITISVRLSQELNAYSAIDSIPLPISTVVRLSQSPKALSSTVIILSGRLMLVIFVPTKAALPISSQTLPSSNVSSTTFNE